ncbi:tyrosine-type recombinase/integrase (plasmid) [Methanolobus sediminis]|uniref:Tyrosine-type recombinase/integrase n=1 Tax=Methanolobus sediminis TaxID=3072978 RepID=A0AA51UQM5_9EURY|nr:tyrosine-type recombinase/integrase [Methanolobus sediminis]WMW26480.1 tyrosine-type recombinase/integrase [Methanolobus sediminis]
MGLIEKFEHDLSLRRRSERTVRSYSCNVREFLKHNPEPENVSYDDLELYLYHLQKRNLKISTLKSNFSAISSFYEFLIYKKITDNNPVLHFRKRYLDTSNDSNRRQILTVSNVRDLINSIDFIRELAIAMLFAKTGIRRTELLELKPGDIDFIKDVIIIARKKRAKNLIRFIDDELHIVLLQYFVWRDARQRIGKCKTDYLFISDAGGRIHKDYINEFLQMYAMPLGLHDPNGSLESQLTSHCFRGFLVTHLRRAGMKKEHIQTLLGHSTKNEVWSGFYLSIDMELVKDDYFRCVPVLIDY